MQPEFNTSNISGLCTHDELCENMVSRGVEKLAFVRFVSQVPQLRSRSFRLSNFFWKIKKGLSRVEDAVQ